MNEKYRDGDMTIAATADLLRRSYTWVYSRAKSMPSRKVYTHRGTIYIRRSGVDQLAAMSVRAPKTGRPRKTKP